MELNGLSPPPFLFPDKEGPIGAGVCFFASKDDADDVPELVEIVGSCGDALLLALSNLGYCRAAVEAAGVGLLSVTVDVEEDGGGSGNEEDLELELELGFG